MEMAGESNSSHTDSGASPSAIRFLSALMKEIGIINFIVLFVVIFLLWYGTPAQKEEFIDTWILLKRQDSHATCIIVVVCLIILSIIGTIFYIGSMKLLRKENERIGLEKSMLQEKLLKLPLSSSLSKPKKPRP